MYSSCDLKGHEARVNPGLLSLCLACQTVPRICIVVEVVCVTIALWRDQLYEPTRFQALNRKCMPFTLYDKGTGNSYPTVFTLFVPRTRELRSSSGLPSTLDVMLSHLPILLFALIFVHTSSGSTETEPGKSILLP